MAVLFQKRAGAPAGNVNVTVNGNTYVVPATGTVSVTDIDAKDLVTHPLIQPATAGVNAPTVLNDTVSLASAVSDAWIWGPSTVASGYNHRHPDQRLGDFLRLQSGRIHHLGAGGSSLLEGTNRWRDWNPGSGATPGSSSVGFNPAGLDNVGLPKISQDFLASTYDTLGGPNGAKNSVLSRISLAILQYGLADYARTGVTADQRTNFRDTMTAAIRLVRSGPYYDTSNAAWAYTGTAVAASPTGIQVTPVGIGSNAKIAANGTIATFSTPSNFLGGRVNIFFSIINSSTANSGSQVAWSVNGGTADNQDYRGHNNIPAADSYRGSLQKVYSVVLPAGVNTVRATVTDPVGFGFTLYGASIEADLPPYVLLAPSAYLLDQDWIPTRGEDGANFTSSYAAEIDNTLVDTANADLATVAASFDQYVGITQALPVAQTPGATSLVLSDNVHGTDYSASRVAGLIHSDLRNIKIPVDYAAWLAGNGS